MKQPQRRPVPACTVLPRGGDEQPSACSPGCARASGWCPRRASSARTRRAPLPQASLARERSSVTAPDCRGRTLPGRATGPARPGRRESQDERSIRPSLRSPASGLTCVLDRNGFFLSPGGGRSRGRHLPPHRRAREPECTGANTTGTRSRRPGHGGRVQPVDSARIDPPARRAPPEHPNSRKLQNLQSGRTGRRLPAARY
jgi:hypothetical protein